MAGRWVEVDPAPEGCNPVVAGPLCCASAGNASIKDSTTNTSDLQTFVTKLLPVTTLTPCYRTAPWCLSCELCMEGLTIPVPCAAAGSSAPEPGCIAGNPFSTTAFIAWLIGMFTFPEFLSKTKYCFK